MEQKKKEYPLWMQVQEVSPYNRKLALIFCLLGLFFIGGLHRLYVRRWLSGFLYFFTFGLLGLGTIFDLIQLYREKFEDNHGLRLEHIARKRWDQKNAIWRYVGWSVAAGRYFINRENIRKVSPNEITCSYLVELNSFGSRHVEAQGLRNAYYVITDVHFENRSGELFVSYLGGSIRDVKGNIIIETPPSESDLAPVDSMDQVIYEAAQKQSFSE